MRHSLSPHTCRRSCCQRPAQCRAACRYRPRRRPLRYRPVATKKRVVAVAAVEAVVAARYNSDGNAKDGEGNGIATTQDIVYRLPLEKKNASPTVERIAAPGAVNICI